MKFLPVRTLNDSAYYYINNIKILCTCIKPRLSVSMARVVKLHYHFFTHDTFFIFSFNINNIIDRVSYFFLASTVIKLPVNTNILETYPGVPEA